MKSRKQKDLGRQEKGLRRQEPVLRRSDEDSGRLEEVPRRFVGARCRSAQVRDSSAAFLGREDPVLLQEHEDLLQSAQDRRHSGEARSNEVGALEGEDQGLLLTASVRRRQDEDRRRLAPILARLAQARLHEAPVLVQFVETVTPSAADLDPSAEDRRLEQEARSKKTKAQ